MRRFFVGVALYTLAAVTPLAAWGGDREIAEQIYSKLKSQQASGVLQGFTLDMDVSDGRVLLKGHVSSDTQRQAVLDSANSVTGVAEVVDQISVAKSDAESVSPAKPKPVTLENNVTSARAAAPKLPVFSLSKALSEQAPIADNATVMPVAATVNATGTSDAELKSAVIRTLGDAQRSGTLHGFGLQVSSTDGDILLRGRARTPEMKKTIMEMVRHVPGVRNVIDDIAVDAVAPVAGNTAAEEAAHPVRHLQPVEVQTVSAPAPMAPAGPVAPAAPVRFAGPVTDAGGAVDMTAVPADAYVPGAYAQAPVPVAPAPMAHAAPRYDSPYLPNYAWPGYAAYPNYAALTYPQQYSPTAWPYIGPFYPYPQVPLGWRKVSLEWDDGWWFLDFTDK